MFSVNEAYSMRLWLIVALLITLIGRASAQSPSMPDPSTLQPPDNCEGNAARLEAVLEKSKEAGENRVTIAIARLGRGEQSRELNRRRLFSVRAYLTAMGLSSQKLITAEGGRTEGYGRIEVYIGGDLAEVFTVGRCKDLLVGICDNELEDRRRYQLPRRSNVSLCR